MSGLYVPIDAPEICTDPHHKNYGVPHGSEHCVPCEICLRSIKADRYHAHLELHPEKPPHHASP